MVRIQWCFSVAVMAGMLAGMANDSRACNVPAFRYALERWPADPYRVLVYYQTGPQGEAYESLQKGAAERGGLANYSLTGVDVTKSEGKALAERRRITAYPWVEIFYPAASRTGTPVWSGPLSVDRTRRILDSRCRSDLAQKLLGGDVAVWILIRSGDEQKDRRALEILKTHLERASATLKIPETGTDLSGNPVDVADFQAYPVRFSLMEVTRNDPAEQLLVSSLLMSEPDLAGSAEPVAFPVFGRGRALYALVGDGIQDRNIREACQSMLDWCSCEIKAQNPGTDLLISADWSRPFGGRMVHDPELPLAGLSSFIREPAASAGSKPARKTSSGKADGAGQTAPVSCSAAADIPISAAPPAPGPAGRNPLVRNVLYLAGAAGLLLLTMSVFVSVKARR